MVLCQYLLSSLIKSSKSTIAPPTILLRFLDGDDGISLSELLLLSFNGLDIYTISCSVPEDANIDQGVLFCH